MIDLGWPLEVLEQQLNKEQQLNNPQQAGYIDYGTKEGQKLFYETSAPLPLKNKFDGKSSEIINFKQALIERGKYSD